MEKKNEGKDLKMYNNLNLLWKNQVAFKPQIIESVI